MRKGRCGAQPVGVGLVSPFTRAIRLGEPGAHAPPVEPELLRRAMTRCSPVGRSPDFTLAALFSASHLASDRPAFEGDGLVAHDAPAGAVGDIE